VHPGRRPPARPIPPAPAPAARKARRTARNPRDRTSHLLAARAPAPQALTAGFQRALLAGSIALAASAIIAFWVANTRRQTDAAPTPQQPEPQPESAPANR
jgi:hypothetical protein